MTLTELFSYASQKPYIYGVLGVLIGAPVLALILPLIHGKRRGEETPFRHIYSAIIYLVCIPGIMAGVMTAYMLFISRQDLMAVNALTSILPIVSMIATLMFIGNKVRLDQIPGFERLSGLITVLVVTFVLVLLIEKTRIWVVFFGSIGWLIALVVGLFVLLRWGGGRMFGGDKEGQDSPT